MASLWRYRCEWGGVRGGAALSTFYSAAAADISTELGVFFNAIKGALPNSISITVPDTGDVINDANGELTGVWTGGEQTIVLGTSSDAYSAPSGAIFEWLTPGIVAGRRVRGKTFLVPITVTNYDAVGTISASSLGIFQAAAATLVDQAGDNMRVWSRPFEPKLGDDRPARTGSSYPVVAQRVPDKSVILRSRRD